MSIVHALGPDKKTCKVCRGPFPCPPWVARTRAEVHPVMYAETVETHKRAGASEDVIARMETVLIKEEAWS